MKLCIIAANLPPVYSGAGLQVLALAREFRRAGHDVFCLSLARTGLPRAEERAGVQIIRLGPPRALANGILQKTLGTLALVSTLVSWRGRYDRILFINPDGGFRSAWLALPILSLLGKRTAVRMTLINSADPAGLKRRRFSTVRLLPYRWHHRVISISSALSASYREIFGSNDKLIFIPNGVDTRRFHPVGPSERATLRQRLGLEPDAHYCVFTGRITHRKGVDILIEAWRHVTGRVDNARLLLVGPADDTEAVENGAFITALRRQIAVYGLSQAVTWVGETDSPETFLQASDVFVFASRREGCPNALLEAMACGLPIVTTRLEGITEDLIDNAHDGMIVPAGPEAFAEAVIAMLSSDQMRRRLSAAAAARATAEFDIRSTALRYLSALEEL